MKDKHRITFVCRSNTYEEMQLHLQKLDNIELSHFDFGSFDDLRENNSEIIIIEYTKSHGNTCSIADEIGILCSDSLLLLITPVKLEPEILKQYMVHGIRDIIGPEDVPSEIISRSLQMISRRAELNGHTLKRIGRTISFFSSKGGVGKSFLAVSTAQILANADKYRTILVDLDLQFGDIDLYLNANSMQTISELFEEVKNNNNRFSDFILDSHIHKVNSNLHFLSAPVSPEKSENIDTGAVTDLLKWLRKKYDFIVLDFGSLLNEITLTAFDISDKIMLVISDEMASIKNAGQTVQLLKRLQINEKKIDYVINKYSEQYPVNNELLMKLFSRKSYMKIPVSNRVHKTLNQGKNLIKKYPGDSAVKAVVKMVKKLSKEWKIELDHLNNGYNFLSKFCFWKRYK